MVFFLNENIQKLEDGPFGEYGKLEKSCTFVEKHEIFWAHLA